MQRNKMPLPQPVNIKSTPGSDSEDVLAEAGNLFARAESKGVGFMSEVFLCDLFYVGFCDFRIEFS